MKKTVKWLLAVCLPMLAAAGCASPEKDAGPSLADAALQRIDQIRSERQLELVEYEISKIVKSVDKGSFWQIGSRKVLLTCKAYLQAGIDLGDFNPMTDVVIDEERKSVTITLPSPKLLSMEMPLKEVLVEDSQSTWFRRDFSMAELNQILRIGEKQILDSVPDLGILDEAKQNARLFFEPALKHMGFTSVHVSFKEPVNENE